jgi:pantothenate kinase
VHLGNLDMINKLEKEDICKSIIYLVATSIARLAATTAIASSLNKIVVVGRSQNYSLYTEVLKRWIEYSGLEVIFLKDGEFATAVGALES